MRGRSGRPGPGPGPAGAVVGSRGSKGRARSPRPGARQPLAPAPAWPVKGGPVLGSLGASPRRQPPGAGCPEPARGSWESAGAGGRVLGPARGAPAEPRFCPGEGVVDTARETAVQRELEPALIGTCLPALPAGPPPGAAGLTRTGCASPETVPVKKAASRRPCLCSQTGGSGYNVAFHLQVVLMGFCCLWWFSID